MPQVDRVTEHWIEWDGLLREDAPLVRVHFSAGGWVPYCPASWTDPAEGGLFEDLTFLRAEIDPREPPAPPLTEAEIAAARAWFEKPDTWERAQSEAEREADASAPTREYDPAEEVEF